MALSRAFLLMAIGVMLVASSSALRFREHDLRRMEDEMEDNQGAGVMLAAALVDAAPSDYGGAVQQQSQQQTANMGVPQQAQGQGIQQQQQQQANSEGSMAAAAGNVPGESSGQQQQQQQQRQATMPNAAEVSEQAAASTAASTGNANPEGASVDMPNGNGGGDIVAAVLQDEEGSSGPNTGNNDAGGCTDANQDSCKKTPARLVAHLTPNARPFDEGNGEQKLRDEMNDGLDENDVVLKELYHRLADVKQEMFNERQWMSRVHAIIEHYKLKVGRVQVNLNKEASLIYRLKNAITSRHKVLERQKLKAKLATVGKVVDRLEQATSQVEGRAVKMNSARSDLQSVIAHLNREIRKLQQGTA